MKLKTRWQKKGLRLLIYNIFIVLFLLVSVISLLNIKTCRMLRYYLWPENDNKKIIDETIGSQLNEKPYMLTEHDYITLKKLTISFNTLSDIKLLANLTSLQELSISGTEVRDIKPLAKLTNLQYLSLNGTNIIDIKPLVKLQNLLMLSLDNTLVNDIAPLVHLPNLKTLYIRGTPVSNKPIEELQMTLPKVRIYTRPPNPAIID
jgi:hypothetical protein